MKKILLLTFLQFLLPLMLMGQESLLNKQVRVESDKGTVEFFLNEICQNGALTLSYGQDVPIGRRVSLRTTEATVQELLSSVLGPGFYFVEFGNKILLKKKAWSDEQLIVKGRVVDSETKEALPGVTIYMPGNNGPIGVISDSLGYFRMEVPPGISIINFSSIGYEQRSLQPDNTEDRVIELTRARQEIDEVTVEAIRIPVDRSINVARAVLSDDVLNAVQLNTIDEALLGRISGVHSVRQTGLPGANIAVKVRGTHSLINSDPAYYLNGMPVQRAVLAAIPPKSIGSIEVLKDPSGTAAYGAYGGNGVVLLNTREDKEYGFHAAFEYYTGIQQLWKSYDLLSGEEFKEFFKLVYPWYLLPSNLDTTSQFDWLNALFQTGKLKEYHLSLSYRNENHSLIFDLGHLEHAAMINNLNLKRYTFAIHGEHKLGAHLRIRENILAADIDYTGLKEGSFMNDYSNTILSAMILLPTLDTGDIPISPDGTIPHPLDDIDLKGNLKNNLVLLGSLGLEFDITDRLRYNASSGVEVLHQENQGYTNSPPIFIAGPDFNFYRNEYGIKDLSLDIRQVLEYDYPLSDGHSLRAMVGHEYGTTSSDWQPTMQLYYRSREDFNEGVEGDTMLYYSSLAYRTDFQRQAAFAALNYDIQLKYFFNLLLRRDWVGFPYNDGMQRPSAWYPSAVFGWMFSEEGVIADSDLLTYGKLRAGIGKAGISPRLNYSYYAQMTRELEFLIAFDSERNTGINNSALLRQSSEQFYWEDKSSANIGLDLGFFNNKLFLTADYFISHLNMGEHYPADNPLAFISELSQRRYYKINYPPNSRILNQGVEAEIVYKESIGKLRSTLGLRFAHLRNKLLEINELPMSFLYDEEYDLISVNIPGNPVGSFYGYTRERIFKEEDCDRLGRVINQPYTYEGDDILYAQPNAGEGDYKFTDLNQDSIIDMHDKSILGNPMPDFTFGFDWRLEYRGFDLNLFIQGSYGNEIFNAAKLWLLNPYGQTNWSREILDSYRSPEYEGDIMIDPGNTDTDLHRLDKYNYNRNLRISDLYIEDGSYLRIKSLQLGYTFKSSWTQQIFMERLRIYLMAKNLYTLTRYSGLDPEVGGWGVDCGIYPQPRSFIVGVNVDF